jgi:hypothetical protein
LILKYLFLLSFLTLSLYANKISQHINLGANNTTIDSQSGNGFDIAFGASVVWENGIFGAFDFNYSQADINNKTTNNYGGDLKLGYKHRDIALYAIGTGVKQSYLNTSGAGFGYGTGAEFTPFKHIGFGLDYKTYSMISSEKKYDFEVTKAYLKILF